MMQVARVLDGVPIVRPPCVLQLCVVRVVHHHVCVCWLSSFVFHVHGAGARSAFARNGDLLSLVGCALLCGCRRCPTPVHSYRQHVQVTVRARASTLTLHQHSSTIETEVDIARIGNLVDREEIAWCMSFIYHCGNDDCTNCTHTKPCKSVSIDPHNMCRYAYTTTFVGSISALACVPLHSTCNTYCNLVRDMLVFSCIQWTPVIQPRVHHVDRSSSCISFIVKATAQSRGQIADSSRTCRVNHKYPVATCTDAHQRRLHPAVMHVSCMCTHHRRPLASPRKQQVTQELDLSTRDGQFPAWKQRATSEYRTCI